MGLELDSGLVGRVVGIFYRTNCKKPPSKPELPTGRINVEGVMLTKGLLKIDTDGSSIIVNIPIEDQCDDDTYLNFTGMLANELAMLLQVPEHTYNITEALNNGGVVARYEGSMLRMNPLTTSMGESDQF